MQKSSVHVYSYRRFSSGRQAKGHSLDRQTAAARRWCDEHDYELNDDLVVSDLGVSAFTGDNVTRGALSGFLTAVHRGLVPAGSILLVESLDRLSRAALPEAVNLLTSIVRAGVRVVSLIDDMEWNNTTIEDFVSFMSSVLLFSRGHEESATKSKRVSAKFQSKRQAGLAVVSAGHGPGWAQPAADRSGWLVVEDEAESVRKTFDAAASGLGGVAIARMANEQGWVLPWRKRANTSHRWEHTGVSRLLRDRRVLGEWQPKRMVGGRLVVDGEPVQNYFPRIIPATLWTKVQLALEGRPGPKRLRGLSTDVFANLLYCDCGERMERKAPSARGYARYYCLGRKAGVSQCTPLAERVLTGPVLEMLVQGKQAHFNPERAVDKAREKLAHAQAQAADLLQRAERVLAALEQGGSIELLSQRLAKLEREREVALQDAEAAKLEMAAVPSKGAEFGQGMVAQAAKIIEDKSKSAERHKLALSIARIVDRIEWSGTNYLMMYLKDGVTFAVKPDASYFAKAEDSRRRRKRETEQLKA